MERPRVALDRPGPLGRLRGRLAREDVLLSGWAAVAQPVLFQASAAPAGGLFATVENWLLGGLYLASGVGAVVAIVTRADGTRGSEGDGPASDRERSLEHRLSLIGPTAAGVFLVLLVGFDLLGAQLPDWLTGVVFVLTVVGAIAGSRLPAIPAPLRRLLVTPFVVAAAGLFDQGVATVAQVLDLSLIGPPQSREDWALVLTIAGIGIAVSWIFYSMLILAPRRLAGDRADQWTWALRYAVFVVSIVIGLGVSALIGRA